MEGQASLDLSDTTLGRCKPPASKFFVNKSIDKAKAPLPGSRNATLLKNEVANLRKVFVSQGDPSDFFTTDLKQPVKVLAVDYSAK